MSCCQCNRRKSRRKFVIYGSAALAAVAGLALGIPFVGDIMKKAAIEAAKPIEVDLSDISEGHSKIVRWNRKPVFIRKLRETEIIAAQQQNQKALLDPQDVKERLFLGKWLVVYGVCSHLGCLTRIDNSDGRIYCSCHGSFFDSVGRVLNGPASENLEIPPHKFVGENKLILGNLENNIEDPV